MKKVYVYDTEFNPRISYDALVMSYEEYGGLVQITMFYNNGNSKVLAYGDEKNIWSNLSANLDGMNPFYLEYASKLKEKVFREQFKEPEKEKENTEMILRTINQFNLSDLSELVQDRTWFEEALELLNNMGKMYRLQIYINGPTWHTVIGDNDSPYPSFSIALHVFLTKIQYYMSMGSKPVEYKDV